jgi:type I restriction enzyme S subunit
MKFEKLGSIVKISKGKKHSLAPQRVHQNFRYIQIEDLRSNENLKYTDEKGVEVHENDLIIAWDGANAGTIGFGLRGMIGSTLARLRIKEEKEYNTDFIGYFLKGQFDYLRANATGATIPHINRDSLEALKIPVLDYPEQYEIAQILSKSDNLIKQRKESIELLDKFLESIFYEMFGDPFANPKKLDTVSLEDVATKDKNSIVDGPFGSSLKDSDYHESGIPIIRINNLRETGFYPYEYKFINEAKYQELKRSKVQYNDLLIARVGNTIGKSCLFNQKYKALLSTTGVAKATIDSSIANIRYIENLFKLPAYKEYIWKQAEGGGQPYLNLKKIKAFKILKPSLAEQNKFAVIADTIELLKSYFKESQSELEYLFGSLNQRAFKGELKFKNIPQKEIGDPLEGMDLPKGELPKLDDIIKQLEGKAEVVSGDDEKEKATSPFEDISTVTGSISNYEPVLADVQLFIQKTFRDNYFIFDNLKQATVKAGWQYDFETLKNYVFELLRKGQLRQVFADASFKASFKESDADYKKITGLTEQMYLQQPATIRL